MNIAALDIETTGLNPADPDAAVTDVALCHGEWTGVFSGDERSVLRDTADALANITATIVTWNGSGFDWPYLLHRAAAHNITLPVTVTGERPGKYQPGITVTGPTWRHADVWGAWGPIMAGLWLPSGLKPVARLFGLNPIEVDRTRMADLTEEERRAYVLSDARATVALAELAGPVTVALWTD